MAMVKPIAQSKNAFDANNIERFDFISSGGNQVVKNKITVRKNSDNSVVYTNTMETFAFYQDIPSNTLVNGEYYNYFFNTYDINNNESPNSNVVPFYCFTTPTLTFTNISNNTTIETSNFLFNVEYAQIEGELLDNLKFVLYDINGNILSESGILRSTDAPPFQLSYQVFGFDNDTNYKIQVDGVTVNGTIIKSELIDFNVRFEFPTVFTEIDLENRCNEGYVQFRSNLVFIDGTSNPNPPIYIDDNAVDLSKMGSWVEWLQGYEIPSNFTLQMWLKPVLLGEFCKLWNNSDLNKYIQINLRRSFLNGETVLKDYIEVYGINNGNYVLQHSNTVDMLNNLSDIIVWIKKVNNTWEVILDVTSHEDNVLNWNPVDLTESNVVYNKITNLIWLNKGTEDVVLQNHTSDINTIFPINNTKISNGVFDHINITRDTTHSYSPVKPPWTYYTILESTFNNTINGGNTNILLSQLEAVKIKRRLKGSFNWITLKEIPINTIEDLNISYQDSYVASYSTYEWALVPILNGAIEAEYIINEMPTFFDGVFISNQDTIFKLYNGVVYGQTTRNKNIGIIQTIGNRYPVFINNSAVDYEQGQITGTLYGYNFETNRTISRSDVVRQTEDLLNIVTSGNAFIIKDWNGNIKLVRMNPSPSVSYNSAYGNGITSVSFDWTEQGEYNSQNDLYRNRLIDVSS